MMGIRPSLVSSGERGLDQHESDGHMCSKDSLFTLGAADGFPFFPFGISYSHAMLLCGIGCVPVE